MSSFRIDREDCVMSRTSIDEHKSNFDLQDAFRELSSRALTILRRPTKVWLILRSFVVIFMQMRARAKSTMPFVSTATVDFRASSEGGRFIEEEVGIQSYVNPHPGFRATLKYRISDFIVHEVDPQKRVITLTDISTRHADKQIEVPNTEATAKMSAEEKLAALAKLVGQTDAARVAELEAKVPNVNYVSVEACRTTRMRIPALLTRCLDGCHCFRIYRVTVCYYPHVRGTHLGPWG